MRWFFRSPKGLGGCIVGVEFFLISRIKKRFRILLDMLRGIDRKVLNRWDQKYKK
jgi:hypothetical protein